MSSFAGESNHYYEDNFDIGAYVEGLVLHLEKPDTSVTDSILTPEILGGEYKYLR